MAGYTRNSRTRWTQRDVKRLTNLARQNTPVRVMSLIFGRTEQAVRSMASLNGVSLRFTNQTPYGKRK